MPPPADEELAERLTTRIAEQGPISVADYMAEANAHYYAHRMALGAAGDFTTAPEISQMFGELIGIWLADQWLRAGCPGLPHYVELGPGRGTMARDALRAMHGAGLEPSVELVETSPLLRRHQAQDLGSARWHDDLRSLPDDGPLLVAANEFFDALPVKQFDRSGNELLVDWRAGRFVRDGEVHRESSAAAIEAVRQLARRLAAQGGSALIIDYGHDLGGAGDTLQAVSNHAFADPWQSPGSRDLTAFVDFQALARAAEQEGVRARGPVDQGDWLERMGIRLRAETLAKAAPDRRPEIDSACERLVGAAQMGRLFMVMALIAAEWPEPAGFG